MGAQWLSGRVHDSRPRGRRFEPHRCHCIVLMGRKESNQTNKKTNFESSEDGSRLDLQEMAKYK